MLLRRPVRHQVGVGDQDARRVGVSCGKRPPACRTAPAVSHPASSRLKRIEQGVEARPSSVQPGRALRRPPGPADARPPRDPGCSAACGRRLRSASSCRSVRGHAGHVPRRGVIGCRPPGRCRWSRPRAGCRAACAGRPGAGQAIRPSAPTARRGRYLGRLAATAARRAVQLRRFGRVAEGQPDVATQSGGKAEQIAGFVEGVDRRQARAHTLFPGRQLHVGSSLAGVEQDRPALLRIGRDQDDGRRCAGQVVGVRSQSRQGAQRLGDRAPG